MMQCFIKLEKTNDLEKKDIPKLLSASKIDSQYSIYPRALHKHEDVVEVLLVRSGSGVYIIDGKRYIIQQGDMIICNSNILHDEDAKMSENLNIYGCALTNITIAACQKNCLIDYNIRPIIHTDKYFLTLKKIMGTIYSLLSSGLKNNENICLQITETFLSLVTKIIDKNKMPDIYKKTTCSEKLALDIKQYIDLHYNEEITLALLGKELHVSAYYLAHVFKNELGYSPIQYITRRRIGEAQSLLIATQYSITYIADIVGYGNPNHFNILFNKYVGMSPGKYRKLYIQL
ncbi:AraC family transcriptional regulator [Pectinatus brassicae]|uniref:AraC-like DNA-binding protein n=1 Tax=Pectinatus brassicae TaxID=862415 RepID=A0A840UQY1_9FIRM|nr:AraC family transcriptional regulator [Pectinatus brassicae]MBB5337128.1 AraC-like DNA-binding protein [Pectinatus brassicae]